MSLHRLPTKVALTFCCRVAQANLGLPSAALATGLMPLMVPPLPAAPQSAFDISLSPLSAFETSAEASAVALPSCSSAAVPSGAALASLAGTGPLAAASAGAGLTGTRPLLPLLLLPLLAGLPLLPSWLLPSAAARCLATYSWAALMAAAVARSSTACARGKREPHIRQACCL